MSLPARSWAAWPLLLASAIVLAQVITLRALVASVGLSVVATWWVTATLLGAGHRLRALVAGAGVTLIAASLTEWLAGATEGPVTRSVLLACGLTVAMLLILATRWPLLALVPGVGLAVSALALGGAGRSLPAAGVIAVAVAVTAMMVGPYRGDQLRDAAHLRPLALALLGVGGAAVLASALAWAPVLGSAGADALVSSGTASPAPSPVLPLPLDTSTIGDSATADEATTDVGSAVAPESAASAGSPPEEPSRSGTPWWVTLLAVVAALSVLLLLVVAMALVAGLLRRAAIGARWVLLRRRLRRGSPAESVAGAWAWALQRRARYGAGLAVSASPDVVAISGIAAEDPDLRALAELASAVAFDPQATVSTADAGRAWLAAQRVGRRPRDASWDVRWAWAAQGPHPVR